jgi:hypothetical protein
MLDLDEDRMRDRNEFELEEYRAHIPRLRARASKAHAIALGSIITAAAEGALFGVLPGHPEPTLGVAAGLVVMSWISSIVKRDALAQVHLINEGGRPTGVWMKLIQERNREEDRYHDVADIVERARVEGERTAEAEKDQWWRQPGSLWHDTDQAIRGIDIKLLALEQAEYAKRLADQEAALAVHRAAKQAEEAERRIAATKRWIEEQREWDAFKEDAQMDARARKERGEWYEPPVGVPGAIEDEDDGPFSAAAGRLSLAQFVEKYGEAGFTARLGKYLPAEARSETVEVRSWNSDQPLRTFRPADGMPVCPRNGEVLYNGRQANIVIASLRNARMGQFRSVPCSGHYHIVNADAHRFRGRP